MLVEDGNVGIAYRADIAEFFCPVFSFVFVFFPFLFFFLFVFGVVLESCIRCRCVQFSTGAEEIDKCS